MNRSLEKHMISQGSFHIYIYIYIYCRSGHGINFFLNPPTKGTTLILRSIPFSVLLVAVFAAVYFLFFVGEIEDLRKSLLDG